MCASIYKDARHTHRTVELDASDPSVAASQSPFVLATACGDGQRASCSKAKNLAMLLLPHDKAAFPTTARQDHRLTRSTALEGLRKQGHSNPNTQDDEGQSLRKISLMPRGITKGNIKSLLWSCHLQAVG